MYRVMSRAYRGYLRELEAPRFDQPQKPLRLSARTNPDARIGEYRRIAAAECGLPPCSTETSCRALRTVSRRRAHGFYVCVPANRTAQVSPRLRASGCGVVTWTRAPAVRAAPISHRERVALRSRLLRARSGRRRSEMTLFRGCEQERQRRSRRPPRRT